ncbi:MAG: hypothetical protein COU08_02215 [Candidatus Harrisonbacteria bacterium CG10_big_fil_rev_8_21_14_0_10_42_17]|uniref:Uncharacterized protein n=1 Tax=Candidatus Harrisonbacteria bacterium CG10_big_fil_rev_8_21_14_0_10_42_17 TaxID=1974584 RepID=A0A2M6WI88_9BACT|nr:MAG: hypothetical protein COU08_02215 [Candidatus Harrisonbacteria bacterium CG10_big_fil_rev_8_21_14_0_10_42_17]
MKPLKFAGVLFIFAGVVCIGAGGFVVVSAQVGLNSLNAVYRAQGVMMEYDARGNFIDRGTVEGGNAILKLLTEDWQYPLKKSSLNPKDPLVNTPDELMVTYARINYHVLHGTQNITLDEDVTYNGEVFEAGEHTFNIDGRYWNDFDRNHPLEGPARELAWTATAHGLLANLAAGTATHSLVILTLFVGCLTIGFGVLFFLGGIAFFSAGHMKKKNVTVSRKRSVAVRKKK